MAIRLRNFINIERYFYFTLFWFWFGRLAFFPVHTLYTFVSLFFSMIIIIIIYMTSLFSLDSASTLFDEAK